MIIELPTSNQQLQLLKNQLQKHKSNFIFVDQPFNYAISKHIAFQTNINPLELDKYKLEYINKISEIVINELANGIVNYCKGNHLIPWNIYTPTAMYNNSYLTVIDDYFSSYVLGKVTIVKSV